MLRSTGFTIPKSMNLIGVVHDEHVSDHARSLSVSLPIRKMHQHRNAALLGLIFGPRVHTRRAARNDSVMRGESPNERSNLILVCKATTSHDPNSHSRHYSVNFS